MEARRRLLQCILQSPKCIPRSNLVSRQPPHTMASYFNASSRQTYFTSSNQNGQTDAPPYAEQPRTGSESTTARTASVQYSEEYYPWGKQLGVASDQSTFSSFEGVIDRDAIRRYLDAIDDEYMKREGGA